MDPVRVLASEDLPDGRRRITIDTVTMGRAQVLATAGEKDSDAVARMLAMVADRVSAHHAIVHNGQT